MDNPYDGALDSAAQVKNNSTYADCAPSDDNFKVRSKSTPSACINQILQHGLLRGGCTTAKRTMPELCMLMPHWSDGSMQVVVRIRPPLIRELQGTALRPYQVRDDGAEVVVVGTWHSLQGGSSWMVSPQVTSILIKTYMHDDASFLLHLTPPTSDAVHDLCGADGENRDPVREPAGEWIRSTGVAFSSCPHLFFGCLLLLLLRQHSTGAILCHRPTPCSLRHTGKRGSHSMWMPSEDCGLR